MVAQKEIDRIKTNQQTDNDKHLISGRILGAGYPNPVSG